MAVSVIGTPANAYGSAPDLGSRPAGSNRLLLFATGIEQTGIVTIDGVSIGGQTLTPLATANIAHTNGTVYNTGGIFYATESQIAAMTSGVATLTWSTTVSASNDIASHWIFLSGVNQAAPIKDSDEIGVTNSATLALAAALDTDADGYVWAYTNNSGDTTHTWSAPTELLDPNASPNITFSDSSAGAATSGAGVTPSVTLAAVQSRVILVAASVSPAANANIANPLALLGVGRAA